MNTSSVTKQTPHSQRLASSRVGGEFYFLAALLFILYSRLLDVFLAGYKIPSITLFATTITALAGGQILRPLKQRTTTLWLAFTALMILSAFFSIWRGGSFQMILNGWLRSLLVYFLIVSLVQNIDQCRRAVGTVGWAVGVLSVLSILMGSTDSGRVFLEQGKLQNPNDLAQVLLLGLPCLWLIFARASTLSPSRFVTLPLLVTLIITLTRTGSRGAMIAVFAMLIFFLVTSVSKPKAMATLAALLSLAAVTLITSGPLRTRYLTLFDADAGEEATQQTSQITEVAAASATARRELLRQSLEFTASHPLLGVGPDMFSEARERNSKREHKFAVYLQTHNTYTQLSSECGIPAALVFIAIVIYTFRTANRIYKDCRNRPEQQMKTAAAVARALCFSVLAFAVTCLFISVAYQVLLPSLTGLVVALECAVRKELAAGATPAGPIQRTAGTWGAGAARVTPHSARPLSSRVSSRPLRSPR